MSAFPESGRLGTTKITEIKGRFRLNSGQACKLICLFEAQKSGRIVVKDVSLLLLGQDRC